MEVKKDMLIGTMKIYIKGAEKKNNCLENDNSGGEQCCSEWADMLLPRCTVTRVHTLLKRPKTQKKDKITTNKNKGIKLKITRLKNKGKIKYSGQTKLLFFLRRMKFTSIKIDKYNYFIKWYLLTFYGVCGCMCLTTSLRFVSSLLSDFAVLQRKSTLTQTSINEVRPDGRFDSFLPYTWLINEDQQL